MIENDNLEYEGQESSDTDFIIDPINGTQKSIAYGLYAQLSSLENFYNRIQNSYKKVAITWLIATFIAIGYIFSQKSTNLPISPLYVLIFILFAAIWGIFLIWFIDISIYQTYFFGVVIEELKLENANIWLTNINKNLAKIQINKKKRIIQGYFYIACNNILLILMYIFSVCLVKFNFFYSTLLLIVFILLSWGLTVLMYRIERPPKKNNPVRKQFIKFLKNSQKKP